jgi:small subunit ribosomal protein S1
VNAAVAVRELPEMDKRTTSVLKRNGMEGMRGYQLSESEDRDEYQELDKLLETSNAAQALTWEHQKGEVIEGIVESFHTEPGQGRGALVSIGGKYPALLPVNQMALQAGDKDRPESYLDIGQTVKVQIVQGPDLKGQYMVSRRELQEDDMWVKVEELQSQDKTVEVEVIGTTPAGLLITVMGLDGFLPGSHLAGGRGEDEELIGKKLPCKFLSVERDLENAGGQSRIVVSNKNAIAEDTMRDIVPGQVLTGVVQGITTYGCFVEVGGISGLLHVTQISHMRVTDISDVLPVGTAVKAMVLDMDKARNKFSLSTKVLERVPGDMLANPAMVYENAEETAKEYHRIQKEKKEAMERALARALGDFEPIGSKDKETNDDEKESLLDTIFGESASKAGDNDRSEDSRADDLIDSILETSSTRAKARVGGGSEQEEVSRLDAILESL